MPPETLVLPGNTDMWELDTLLDGGPISLGQSDRLGRFVYYACSPRTYCIINDKVNRKSKSCYLTVYGPVADFEGAAVNPERDGAEQRVYVRLRVSAGECKALHREFRTLFSAALMNRACCPDSPVEDRFHSQIAAWDLLSLLDLPKVADQGDR